MLTVFLLLVAGVAARRWRYLPDGSAAVLDAVVVRISLPALILSVVPDIPLAADVFVPLLVAWGQLVLLAGAVLLAARLLRLDPVTRATLLIVVPLGNTAFLGFPAVEALLGPEALPFAVVYDQLGSFIALTTYGSLLAARLGRTEVRRAPVRAVLTFPPFLGLVAALAFRLVGMPPVLDAAMAVVGATVTPLAVLAIGLRIDLGSVAYRPGALALGLGLRMLAAPAVVLLLARSIGAEGLVWDVTVLQAAMPPMITAAVVASNAGLDSRLASALSGLGVVVAMGTLPLWVAVLG
jgi:malate permease and related proteins